MNALLGYEGDLGYPAPPNPEPIAGDMHFDEDERWNAGSNTDIFSVALHELGHALGLGHSDNPSDVMYPYYRRGMQLSANDIGAARQLYGAPAVVAPIEQAPISAFPLQPAAQGRQQAVLGVLARELGLEEVDFPGRIPDDELARILSTADVCLAPDPKNPLNDLSTMNKIVEYMAMSRPIVAYDLVEARASAGNAALYAEPNDERSFALRIAELLGDPKLRTSMGAEGRLRIETALSWAHSEDSLLAAYDRALGPKAIPSPPVEEPVP